MGWRAGKTPNPLTLNWPPYPFILNLLKDWNGSHPFILNIVEG